MGDSTLTYKERLQRRIADLEEHIPSMAQGESWQAYVAANRLAEQWDDKLAALEASENTGGSDIDQAVRDILALLEIPEVLDHAEIRDRFRQLELWN